ncbi:MAG: hypothetical protein ACTHZ9_08575 [Leucobacter sp.]|uniref:hypothetical protein n=1 Tax=Agrococcus casei TaxID=343512 RepID=UPI003F923B0D
MATIFANEPHKATGPAKNDAVHASVKRFVHAARGSANYDVALSVLDQSTEMFSRRQSVGGGLTDEQAKYLVASGAMTQEEFDAAESHVARGDLAANEQMTAIKAIARTRSRSEVNRMLRRGRTFGPGVVRRGRVVGSAGAQRPSLYSFTVRNLRRYPSWQFVSVPGSDRAVTLPGLREIVAAIPKRMHPATLQGFMETPQESLLVNDTAVTPVQWLQTGGDVDAVLSILEGLTQA